MDLELQRDLDRERTDSEKRSVDASVPGRRSASASLQSSAQPVMSGLVMRKGNGDVEAGAEDAVARASSSSGQALPGELRTKFESSLGTDLSDVRVHTGSESHQAADAVGAKAYAVGNDVHFGAGQYDPHSNDGQHLIAHEVAHTVQQRGGSPTRQNKLAVSSPGDSFEREADSAASAMVSGSAFSLASAPAVIAREPKKEPSGTKAGASAKPDGAVTASISTEFKTPPVKFTSIPAEAEGKVAVKGSITLSSTTDAEQAKAQAKATDADAKSAAGELAKQHFTAEGKPESYVQDWDVEILEGSLKPDPFPGKKKKGGFGVGIAPKVKIKCRNASYEVGCTIASVEREGGKIEVKVLEVNAKESLGLWSIPEGTTWNGFKVSGGLTLDLSLLIKPDKTAIAAKIAQKYAVQLFGRAAASNAGTAVAEIMASLPALVGIVGGYITIRSTLASLQDTDDMWAVAAAAEQAVYGYAGGFSAAVGGKNVAGDPAWHASGAGDGQRMLGEQVAKIQAMPEFAQHNFSAEEIRGAIMEKAAGDAIYDAVYGGSFARIKETYVQVWKAQLGTFQKLFTNTDGDERDLRARMGSKGEVKAADMPEGGKTGLEKEGEKKE
jgi:hypothetical protein